MSPPILAEIPHLQAFVACATVEDLESLAFVTSTILATQHLAGHAPPTGLQRTNRDSDAILLFRDEKWSTRPSVLK